jgi:hypothetical protein
MEMLVQSMNETMGDEALRHSSPAKIVPPERSMEALGPHPVLAPLAWFLSIVLGLVVWIGAGYLVWRLF